MTTVELLEAIRDALADDKTLTDWCQAQFGKAPEIHLGIDEHNPPESSDDYPIVAIVGVSQRMGQTQREITWEVDLSVAVIQETILTSGSKRTFQGMLEAEEMRELVENALYRAKLASADSQGESWSDSYFPLFGSYTTMTMAALKTTRKALPG